LHGISRAIPALVVAVVAASGVVFPAAPGVPVPLPHTQAERVHRVQVDVSVIDPRGSDWASVPDLPRDAFELRIEGRGLPTELAERVEFDEICPRSEEKEDRPRLADPVPILIVVADLNYLDLPGRHATAKALAELADAAAEQPLRVKVLAFSRRLIPLTDGFESDPAALRAAATSLREVKSPGPPIVAEGGPSAERERAEEDFGPSGDENDPVQREERFRQRDVPALELLEPGPGGGALESEPSGLHLLTMQPVDPRPSLAAIESVMLAHAGLSGRKALVLFSGSQFELPDDLWLDYMPRPLEAAEAGFALWAVDAAGLRPSAQRSRLLQSLSSDTGGEFVHNSNRLSIAFERAREQLSCYYLFSIPFDLPEGDSKRRVHVDIRLNTDRYPDYWRYRVRGGGHVTLLTGEQRDTRRRLAALLEPGTHGFPEVRVSATYPHGSDRVTQVGVATLLSDLTFTRGAEAAAVAEVTVEGVVTDENGRQVCRIGDGRRREVHVSEPPARFPPSQLVFEKGCRLQEAGRYDLRVAVQDVRGGGIGAARATLAIADKETRAARISALRLGRNSGRDFLLDFGRSGSRVIPRDRARRAFVPLGEDGILVPQDRLIVRFVSCGETPPIVVGYQVRQPSEPDEALEPLFRLAVGPRSRPAPDASCIEYEGAIPENSLEPGRYGIALIEPVPGASDEEGLEGLMQEGAVSGRIDFQVSPPTPPTGSSGDRAAVERRGFEQTSLLPQQDLHGLFASP
jgi:VWFA-related protein